MPLEGQRPVNLGDSMDATFDRLFRPTPGDSRTDGEKLIGVPKREQTLSELLASMGKTKD